MYTVKKVYNQCYKAGFKAATALIAAAADGTIPSEPVQCMCNRLYAEYRLAYNCKKH
jgi:hypothetical protein